MKKKDVPKGKDKKINPSKVSNPNHFEDFEKLLKKAAKPRKQPRT